MSAKEEADQLFELLNAEELPPFIATTELGRFSDESKNELIARLAHTTDPGPRGRLLARLPLILTDENREDMGSVFVTNLRSPNLQARKASLYGLATIDHPDLIDLASASLLDNSDQVLSAACDLLLATAKGDPHLRKSLQDVYSTHKDDSQFYMTLSLLEAHGFTQ